MFGYLKTRPHSRALDLGRTASREEDEYRGQGRSVHESLTNTNTSSAYPQTAGYLSWESISYFFGKWTTDDWSSPSPLGKKLEETQVDSDLIKQTKKHPRGKGVKVNMEKTMEYTVTSYDTLPKIALKFDVTPSELTRLNRLAIRTLYPGQVLRVPCPKPTEDCEGCAEAVLLGNSPPQSMTMNHHHHGNKAKVAKRVSFEDIDEDVLETFIKVKSKYITDGQGVVKGILLITPHAVIFHPDLSEILVVDRGAEYYQVHFPMDSVCAAGMFDDIAEMVVHDALQPGHFFLDKPLMKWLGESDAVLSREEDQDGGSSSTLHASMSSSGEPSAECLTETSESLVVDSDDVPKSTTSLETKMAEDKDTGDADGEGPLQETKTENHTDDVIVSSSSHQVLSNDGDQPLPSDTEQLSHVTDSGHVHQMNSTPKLKPYMERKEEEEITSKGTYRDIDGHSYTEGISKDSGIDEHMSRENVHGDSMSTDDSKTFLGANSTNPGPVLDSTEIIPRLSTCHVDMPKYLCVRIKKTCWPALRPRLCSHAHETIQRANDERRELWFSIPSGRLLDVYAFFLEKCPAIHDGETEDESSDVETDFVGSCGSDYSVITMSDLPDDEAFKPVDNFYSKSPDKEKIVLQRRRTHSREKKKKKKTETKEVQRKSSSWSVCSIEEPILPEMIGKSEILTESDVLKLSQHLPSRTIGHSWRLVYSTHIHGISLKTLYRVLADYDTPALLVIKDDSQKVFGAFASSPFAVSDHFYGTGECFLYTFCPDFKIFRWSGENNFFIKGDIDSLAFGGGEGNFGLWLDEDLYHGSTHHCLTFNNGPLTETGDFLCCAVETWCFE